MQNGTKIDRAIFFITAILLLSIPTSQASVFSYEIADLGINRYQYRYTIENDGSLPNNATIQLFDIYFDPSLYDMANLSISSDPLVLSDWSEQFLASAPALLIPTAYDALSNGVGIVSASHVTGFAVDFTWLGFGKPGSQMFEIYDPNTFELLETGITQPLGAVPIPTALPLFISALLGITGLRISTRFKQRLT